VPNRLHSEGDWPDRLTIRRSWAKATARPWNGDGPEVALRLERGSSDFLRAVVDHLRTLATGDIFSPALYPPATKVWQNAGFSRFSELHLMERPVGSGLPQPIHPITLTPTPDWGRLAAVDHQAFAGFWRMSEAGLVEAMTATPRAVVLEAAVEGETAGFALVGAQMTVSFLQRVAVAPSFSGRGLGTSLIRSALVWGAKRGTQSMVLNVRPENLRARQMYEKEGFRGTGSSLVLMRFDD